MFNPTADMMESFKAKQEKRAPEYADLLPLAENDVSGPRS